MPTHVRLHAGKLLTLLLFMTPYAAAQQTAAQRGDEARVLALEVLWNQAELKRDAKALDQILADHFIYTDIDGSLERKAEFMQSVRNPTDRISSIGSESMSAEMYDNTVVVYGIYVEKGTSNGKPYLHRGRFTDTWIKQGMAWKCVASHVTLMQK